MASEYDALLAPAQSEYDALLTPPPQQQKTSLGRDIATAVGRSAVGAVKGIVTGFLEPKSGIQQIGQDIKNLSMIVHGERPPDSPEAETLKAPFDPNLSREQRIEAGLGAGLTVAGALLPFAHGARIKLGDIIRERARIKQPGERGFILKSEQEAAVARPKEEVKPSATEERKVEESVQPERPGDDTRGTPAEAGVSGGVQPTEEVVPQEAVKPTDQPRPVDLAQAGMHADIPADGGFSDHPLIQFLRDEVGGILSRSGARSKLGKEAFEGNKSLWDSAPEFPDSRHNKIYNSKTGVMPDEAASAAVEAGLLPQGADASTLFSEIGDISENSHRLAKTGREARATIKTGAKQFKSFTAAVAKQEKGEAPINASQLNVGDTVTVKGEPMKVTAIDPDNFDVTLEDGSRFGIQHVGDNEVFYGEHEPVKGGETVGEKEKTVDTEGQGEKGVLEPAAEEKPPAPTAGEPSLGGIKQTVAERRSGIEPGRGWTPQEAINWGEGELQKDPAAAEPILEKAYTTGSLSGEEMAIARAQIRRHEQATNKAKDALYKDPTDPTLQANADAADRAEAQARARLKPAQTDWGKAGAAQQYETDIDTGSIHGLRRMFQTINKRDVTPKELAGLEKEATKNQQSAEAEAKSWKKWSKAVDKATNMTKLKTREELSNHFAQRLKELLPCKKP